MAAKILVVDDEKNMRALLVDLLELEGFEPVAAADGESALEALKAEPIDLVVLDLRLPGIQGMDVLKTMRADGRDTPVVIITAHGDVNTAVEALKNGASDFIVKPFDNSALLASLRQALDTRVVLKEAELSRPRIAGQAPDIVGKSPEMLSVFETINKIAGTAATVLIQGESGTGKELVARAIHLNSDRRDGPLISINCAAMPDTLIESELFGYERGAFTGAHARKAGKIELAHGGTLFLDEVGELSPSAQAKLLRVLDERELTPLGATRSVKVDIRVMAATNRDLQTMAEEGRFRKDLFYRLNVMPVNLPPLRERTDDLEILANFLIDKMNARYAKKTRPLDKRMHKRLKAYSWPGNIRELEHVIEQYVIVGRLMVPEEQHEGKAAGRSGGAVRAADSAFPEDLDDSGSLKERVKRAERAILIEELNRFGGNKTDAARSLKISYKTLFNKISEHNIRIKTEIE